MGMEEDGMFSRVSTNGRRSNDMKLMEVILRDENLDEAIKRVKSNKGVAGVDKMTVDEIDEYFKANKETAMAVMKVKVGESFISFSPFC